MFKYTEKYGESGFIYAERGQHNYSEIGTESINP